MTFNLSTFEKSLKSAFKKLKKTQSEILAVEIAANYTAGRTAAEKHKSTIQGNTKELPRNTQGVLSSKDEEEGLSDEEKTEIALLTALFLGYITKFNDTAQAQVLSEVKSMVQDGKTQEEIKEYVQGVFEGKESIVIDNVGKTKKEIYVDKDLKLSEVDKVIEKPFYTSLPAYAALLGATVAHVSYEKGREMSFKSQNFSQWVFVGPVDEIARPWHISLIGQVYEYGTLQSEYAQKVLREPRCRHRAEVFYNDKTKDTDPKEWQRLKDSVGLFFNETSQQWEIKI
jgi:hypothetical protein